MVVTHVAAPPMAGSNRAAVRHTSRRTSWATSSDWDGSRRTLRITPYTGPTSRSYTASNASVSPRATWTSRRSRSRSPLLSVAADLNLDASESVGFICHLRSRRRIGWVVHGEILNNLARRGPVHRGAGPEYPHTRALLPRSGGPTAGPRGLISLTLGVTARCTSSRAQIRRWPCAWSG